MVLSKASSAAEVITHLQSLGSEYNRQGMKRYGIRIDRALGISHGDQRRIGKAIGRNHERAFELWSSGITEAQFIASITADPKRFRREEAHAWASSFDSWDIVDGVSDLFVDTDHWRELIDDFAANDREFVRRTAFAMMAWASVHRKKESDATFLGFFATIEQHASDDRNFVRKAVSWALRSIGKRNAITNAAALAVAGRLASSSDSAARQTGREAQRDLTSEATRRRLEKKKPA